MLSFNSHNSSEIVIINSILQIKNLKCSLFYPIKYQFLQVRKWLDTTYLTRLLRRIMKCYTKSILYHNVFRSAAVYLFLPIMSYIS